MTPDLSGLLRALSGGGVNFIIVGGVAANLHGALRTTLDLDVVYSRSPDNITRLAAALAPYRPYLRGAPPGLPFLLSAETITHGLNFTLTTSLGDVDLLGEVTGGGGFESLSTRAEEIELDGFRCLVVTLPALIALKRATGRGKDREALAELEALLEEREG
jgi:predicted nucleotidyltransferase